MKDTKVIYTMQTSPMKAENIETLANELQEFEHEINTTDNGQILTVTVSRTDFRQVVRTLLRTPEVAVFDGYPQNDLSNQIESI